MVSWSSIARACSVAAVALAAGAIGCQSKSLPEYGVVPEFTLTAQDGRPFDSKTLNGNIWVADFFFTNCTGPCPRMSSQMHRIQNSFDGVRDLKLISFTVDPSRDTPPVMAVYAQKFRADPQRWTFLTGPIPELNHLSRDVFMLGNVDGNLDHSTRFVLVDRRRRVRGFYLTAEADAIPRLMADIKVLLKERS